MGKPPAFQMYASDFLVDTNDWTVDEVGIYLRLLLSEWVNGALPNDDIRLARIAGCDKRKFAKKWCKNGSVIASKFETNGSGFLVNKRLELEREKQINYLKLQSIKGKMGGRPKKSRSFPSALTEQKPEESSSSSSSNNKEKKYIKKRKSLSITPSEEPPKITYGEFKNVLLTDEELSKLKTRFGEQGAKERIENLSQGIESKGYKYKSHYATILTWDRKNNPVGVLSTQKDEYENVTGQGRK